MAKGKELLIVAIIMVVFAVSILYITKPKPVILSVMLSDAYYFELDSERNLKVMHGVDPHSISKSGKIMDNDGYEVKKLTEQEYNSLIEYAEGLSNIVIYELFVTDARMTEVFYKDRIYQIQYDIFNSSEFIDIYAPEFSGNRHIVELINMFIEYSPMPIV